MKTFSFYANEIPDFVYEVVNTDVIKRLKNVGMNCGVEYTSFPLFENLESYSRYDHSVGVGLITYRFTNDIKMSISALLHDISTPVFAHTIDFLNGDYEMQESTERLTSSFIANSKQLISILNRYGLTVNDVDDYHKYPIADNESPKLSADRLEYTLGNTLNYGFLNEEEISEIYLDLTVGKNNFDEDELMFNTFEIAEKFALNSLKCSKVYASKEDRYAMQILAELLNKAIARNVISYDDLYKDEPFVIEKIQNDEELNEKWKKYVGLSQMIDPKINIKDSRIIKCKKRYINPYVLGKGRVLDLSNTYEKELREFLDEDFNELICAI